MLKLHFGEDEVEYPEEPSVAGHRGHARKSKTTVDVAKRIEARYALFATFFEVHAQDIADDLAQTMTDSLTDVLLGASLKGDPLVRVGSRVEERFKKFLESQEAEQVGIPGTPTKAALMGVSHRRKHSRSKDNPRRPSFIDYGLLMAHFRAWVEDR